MQISVYSKNKNVPKQCIHTYIHITFDSRTISSKLQVCFSYKSKRQFFNVISGGSWTTFSLWPGWCRSFAPDANAICYSWHTGSFAYFYTYHLKYLFMRHFVHEKKNLHFWFTSQFWKKNDHSQIEEYI